MDELRHGLDNFIMANLLADGKVVPVIIIIPVWTKKGGIYPNDEKKGF